MQSSHQSVVNVHKHSVITKNHIVIRNERTLPTPIPPPIPSKNSNRCTFLVKKLCNSMFCFIACGTLNGFNCYRFNTGCYCVVTTQMNWTMAYNYCLNNGRSLLSIETQAKQDDLQVNLPSIIGTGKKVFFFK